jgi:hypothetical protein
MAQLLPQQTVPPAACKLGASTPRWSMPMQTPMQMQTQFSHRPATLHWHPWLRLCAKPWPEALNVNGLNSTPQMQAKMLEQVRPQASLSRNPPTLLTTFHIVRVLTKFHLPPNNQKFLFLF